MSIIPDVGKAVRRRVEGTHYARCFAPTRVSSLACGFLHADKVGRDSLVYDPMDLERPAVDGLALDFLAHTTFQ